MDLRSAQTKHQLPVGTIDAALKERREIIHSVEAYSIQTFSEDENPEGAFRAQQIQGESYVSAGFIYDTALDSDGRMYEELDRSRGSDVLYKLATSIDGDPLDQAALRIITMHEDGDLDDLHAYNYCDGSLFDGADEALKSHIATYGPQSVKEIAALAKADRAGDLSSFELIRNIIQESIRDEANEVWLITFAAPAYDKIRSNFGNRAVTQIGEPVRVDVGDPRTSDNLRLIPTVIYPHRVLDGLVQDIDDASAEDPRQQARLVRTLMFLADGMKESDMSEEVYGRVDFMNKFLVANNQG